MCYGVYIGTDKTLEVGTFVADQTDIYFKTLRDEEEMHIRPKFSKKNIYYVGSQSSCSCGLAFDSDDFDNPEEQTNKKSPARFIEFLNEMTLTEDIEYYCCWEYDWDLPIEIFQELDIREISLDKNYFGLTEKEFIKFSKQGNVYN